MAKRSGNDDDFSFEIVKHYGVISTSSTGWTKELNLVKWNGKKAKFDIRDWHPDHSKMSKGITLTEKETGELSVLLEMAASDGGFGTESEEREELSA